MHGSSEDWHSVNHRGSCPGHRQVGFAMARELGLQEHAFANAEARIDAIALTLADARLPGNAEAELMET